jgi:hypothetical protein
MWQCLTLSAQLLQYIYLQQSIQVHMHPADNERYLRFLGRFSIVGPQYGSHFVTLLSHALRFLENSSPLFKMKITLPVTEDFLFPSVDYTMCIWFVTTQNHFVFEGGLRT